MKFAHSGITEGIQKEFSYWNGLYTPKNLPAIRIIKPMQKEEPRRYAFEQIGDSSKMTWSAIVDFSKSFKEGKLNLYNPEEASDDIPEDNSGPIKTLVSKQYEEMTGDLTKDVMVFFWIDDNEDVDKLEPHFKAIGEHVKNVDDLVLAKYNVKTNENKVLTDQVNAMGDD